MSLRPVSVEVTQKSGQNTTQSPKTEQNVCHQSRIRNYKSAHTQTRGFERSFSDSKQTRPSLWMPYLFANDFRMMKKRKRIWWRDIGWRVKVRIVYANYSQLKGLDTQTRYQSKPSPSVTPPTAVSATPTTRTRISWNKKKTLENYFKTKCQKWQHTPEPVTLALYFPEGTTYGCLLLLLRSTVGRAFGGDDSKVMGAWRLVEVVVVVSAVASKATAAAAAFFTACDKI